MYDKEFIKSVFDLVIGDATYSRKDDRAELLTVIDDKINESEEWKTLGEEAVTRLKELALDACSGSDSEDAIMGATNFLVDTWTNEEREGMSQETLEYLGLS